MPYLEDDIVPANALLSSSFNLSLVVGPGLGGLLFALSSVRGALFIDALSFVCSAALLLRLPALLPSGNETDRRGWRGFFQETGQGLLYLSRHKVARDQPFSYRCDCGNGQCGAGLPGGERLAFWRWWLWPPLLDLWRRNGAGALTAVALEEAAGHDLAPAAGHLPGWVGHITDRAGPGSPAGRACPVAGRLW